MEDCKNNYIILEARNGDKVPALVLPSGQTQALHSLIDPKREAQKLLSTIDTEDTGFFIFLGLGGGFAVEEALEHTCAQALIIDFNKDSLDSLLSLKDYSRIFKNERVSFLIDPSPVQIINFIVQNYLPALLGGIKTIPLRARIEADSSKFSEAANAIAAAIESVSNDYSVQAHFAKRWFSNIIRNLRAAEMQTDAFSAFGNIKEATIAAAGPSLDLQITELKNCKSRGAFIICADTALPALLHHSIMPDAVVSIDCQHISYYHFMTCKLKNTPLFLDIASPPLLANFSTSPLFFSSAHPLAIYISKYWKPLPLLDTSGGNVTYACLSLAQNLGAERITLFGADFSYVNSSSYARGAYIFPFFEKKQNRLSPMEALFSTFLYRSPFIQEPSISESENPAAKNEKSAPKKSYYETAQLRFYREKLEQKAEDIYASTGAKITAAPGLGAPINLPQNNANKVSRAGNSCADNLCAASFCADSSRAAASCAADFTLNNEKAKTSARDFLEQYCGDIAALPFAAGKAAKDSSDYLRSLNEKDRILLTTLLPLAAAIKKRNPALKTGELINTVKKYCALEIKKVLSAGLFD